jgi:holo-[acyl-carrier protein] synthase
MIVGLGIDLERIDRFESTLARWGERFEKRLFTDAERAYCRGRGRPAMHFAARFAAKEAALKAMGVPRQAGLEWQQFEIVSGDNGAPRLVLTDNAAAIAAGLGATRVHVSLTHTDDLAQAIVILES